jgi:hypothetical protein
MEIEPAQVQPMLYSDLHEKKLRIAMAERFEKLRGAARVDNYLAGASHAPTTRQAAAPRRDAAVRPASSQR